MASIDAYSENNQDSNFAIFNTSNTLGGQSITGRGTAIGSAQFYLLKSGSPTGNATVQVFAHSGTFGVSSVGTGAALATSDTFDVSNLTTSFQLTGFTFSAGNQIVLDNGTNYVLVVAYSGGDVSNLIRAGADATSPTHGGNRALFAGSWAANSTIDVCFYLYDINGPLIPTHFYLRQGFQ